MKKYFLSFASSNLTNSLKRIGLQAKKLEIYDEIILANESLLETDFKHRFGSILKKEIRGYGYWCWKPQIIKQTLEKMENGDILHYADAGCHLNPRGISRLKDYFLYASISDTGILAFQSKLPEFPLEYNGANPLDQRDFKWVKGDLLDYFDVRFKEEVINTETIGAGIIFIKKNKKSMAIIKAWNEVISKNFSLLDDSASKSPNLEGFIEHRHDQAIFSILSKIYKVETISSYEYFYPKKNSKRADWRALKNYPIHAKRDKDYGLLTNIKNTIQRLNKKIIG